MTNLKAVERLTGMKYHRLRAAFNNGDTRMDTREYTIYKTELIKGKQTAPEPKQSSARPEPEPVNSGDLFDTLLK